MYYAINDWDKNYETFETRKKKTLGWVLVPNRHDSPKFAKLISRPDGPAIFGIWNLILQLASRCSARGILADSSGTPYTAEDMALTFRLPEPLVADALAVLIDTGWMHQIDEISQKTTAPASRASVREPVRDVVPETESPTDARTESRKGSMKKVSKVEVEDKLENKKESNPPSPPNPPTDNERGRERENDLPKVLDTPRFREVWMQWQVHCREKGKPLTNTRRMKQLEDLASRGVEKAVEALNMAIARDFAAPAMTQGKGRSTGQGSAEISRAGDNAAETMSKLNKLTEND